MATFSTWDALITTIKNDIATHLSDGGALIGEYSMGSMRVKYRTVEEAERWLDFAERQKNRESGRLAHERKSYGRQRRFR